MRTTFGAVHRTVQQDVERTYGRFAEAQRRVSSGKRLSKLSDGPGEAVAAARLRTTERRLDVHLRAADDAQMLLGSQDNALQQASNLIQRARDLVTQASNSVESPASREAHAAELENIRTQLADLANTRVSGRAVFAGSTSEAVVTAGDGTVSFTGDNFTVQRRLAPGVDVDVTVSAEDAFGFASGDDVFAVLGRSIDAVRAGDAAASGAEIDNIKARHQDVLDSLGTVGALQSQVDHVREGTEQRRFDAVSQRSALEDVDFAESALELAQAQTAYEAALAAAARLEMPSLMDFVGR
ncbi:MAG: flagellin [Actinomycetota bacterium]|nr:flagellin [Actinomycetota bacterium]